MTRQLQELVAVVDDYLATHLAGACDQPLLEKSMAYSLLAGGKRLRPTLTIAVAELLGKPIDDDLVRAACALELIHTYSLIHDDLPAMDNDDLRRGKPTNHRVYGPGVATLAGDGLLTLAFEWVSDNQLKAPVRLRLVQELAKAAGPAGMVAGQATDVSATGQELTLAQLKKLHRQKTGALLRYAVLAGGLIAEQETAVLDCLTTFGEAYGLAFQIYDDILDVTATTAEMGKATHKDQAEQKNTYPGLLGLAGAKGELEAALTTARGAAAELGRLTGKETVILDDFLAYYRI